MQHPIDDRIETMPGGPPARSFVMPVVALPGENPAFPVIGAIAPVVGAIVIWLITGSPFVLIFAGLGPIVAVAGVFDQRRGRRRRRLRNRATFVTALADVRRSVSDEIDRRRVRLRALTPGAHALLRASRAGENRWRAVDSGQRVALGLGPVPSDLRLDGGPTDDSDPEVARLRRFAASIPDAPVTADCATGIAICGPAPIARALARGYLVQLLSAIAPESLQLLLPETQEWLWASRLPHTAAQLQAPFGPKRARAVLEVLDLIGGPARNAGPGLLLASASATVGASDADVVPSVLVLAASPRQVPAGCSTLVQVLSVDRVRITVSDRSCVPLKSELVSVAEAAGFARMLVELARESGTLGSGLDLWQPVRLAQLWEAELRQPPTPSGGLSARQPTLAAPVGRAGSETIILDLVADGPHALVGGTTGSGKSELLVTWVTAMATAYSPQAVTFLLVDFKGGAAFAPLTALPHCVGVITDLGRTEATRALESLAAEIKYRESVLHRAAARNVGELREHTLARLVVVVDEFAAMLDEFPDLYALFVDIAARGRSLGMHIILCTQRPAGVVRDALLANCNLRLSLRVNNGSDSEAVLGTAAAAALPVSSPGACCLAAAGTTIGFMVATTCTDAIEWAGARHARGLAKPRRPWLDPLPATIGFAALEAMAETERGGDDHANSPGPAGGFLLGVTDLPQRQRQELLRYRPAADGNLVLLGAARSGKSNCLRLLAAQSQAGHLVQLVPRGIEGAWDAVTGMARRATSGDRRPATLLLIDDLDSLLARIPPEYTHEFLDAVQLVARDGARVGIQVVVTLRRSAGLASILALFDQTILLRMGSREDYLLAGGETARWDGAMPAGGGIYRENRVQLGSIDDAGSAPEPQPVDVVFQPGQGYLVITSRPRRRAQQLRGQPGAALQVVEIADEADRAREYADRNSQSLHPQPGLYTGSHLDTALRPGTALRPDIALGPGTALISDTALVVGGLPATVLIGDTDHWQSQSALIGRLRHSHTLVFDGCTPAEFRMITRSRDLPPLIEPGRSRVWWLANNAEATRLCWPQS